MDRNHVFDDHSYAESGAGLDSRACNGCVHARLHGNVDSRQRFLGIYRGPAGYTLFFDYRGHWHRCPILVLISRLPDTPVDLGAWDHWGKPMLVGEVDPNQGPVLVTVEYEVDPKKADEFLEALHKFARVRRRDGASRWGVYRDTEHPAQYVETFIVESWAEHLRQHKRLTRGDRDLEENVSRFESKPVKVRHFIYAHSKHVRHYR